MIVGSMIQFRSAIDNWGGSTQIMRDDPKNLEIYVPELERLPLRRRV